MLCSLVEKYMYDSLTYCTCSTSSRFNFANNVVWKWKEFQPTETNQDQPLFNNDRQQIQWISSDEDAMNYYLKGK